MLLRLIRCSLALSDNYEHEVISIGQKAEIGTQLEELGINVRALDLNSNLANPFLLFRLKKWVAASNPDAVQTWMYHGDLIGGIGTRMAGSYPLSWGIHNTVLVPGVHRRSTIWISQWSARLSKTIPDRIHCCSEASKEVHAAIGYDESKMVVIPNGTDMSLFTPNQEAGIRLRKEMDIPPEAYVIGMVARFDPAKDHENFVKAAGLLSDLCEEEVHFVLCGLGCDWDNTELAAWVDDAGIREHLHPLGLRTDIPLLMNAFDILAISSEGEAFPLVAGEAMATGVPCVVTDVGDSSIIVADTGEVVPPKDSEALAKGFAKMIQLGKEGLAEKGRQARNRIEQEYRLEVITQKYENHWREMIEEKSGS